MSGMFIRPVQGFVQAESVRQAENSVVPTWDVPLKTTDEPVSPEDERAEDQALKAQGERVPVAADASFADMVVGDSRFGLPLRLPAKEVPQAVANSGTPVRWDYIGFRMPPSFAGPEDARLQRLKLRLRLFIPGEPDPQNAETSSALATAVYLEPENVHGKQWLSGEAGLDLAGITELFPPLKVLKFTATVPFQAEKHRQVIQLEGMGKYLVSWYIGDPDVASDFQPTLIAQFPAGSRLAVEAKLHVELRATKLGIPHRFYAINAPGKLINYVRAPNDDTFVAVNPAVSSSRMQEILLGDCRVEPPRPLDAIASMDTSTWWASGRFTGGTGGTAGTGVLNPRHQAEAQDDQPGAVQPAQAAAVQENAGPAGSVSLVEDLIRLASMLEKDLLTRDEFDRLKARLLADL